MAKPTTPERHQASTLPLGLDRYGWVYEDDEIARLKIENGRDRRLPTYHTDDDEPGSVVRDERGF